ncbi:MAG: hypothetical protein ACJAWV_000118 [Flammeovirgaceae bacterium]|jgi:hypothetical protein
MKKYLFYFALTCWVLSLTAHLISLADVDITETIPFVWLLHVGIFVVWVPVVIDLNKGKEMKELQKSKSSIWKRQKGMYNILFKGAPSWMRFVAIAGFFYATINFMLFMSSQGGTPSIEEGGGYVLENRGELVKTLTKEEYHHYKANEVRGFSGHWILFYGIATVALFRFSGFAKEEGQQE